MTHRIALVHATAMSIDPVKAAFAALWPEAEPVDILDSALSVDRAKTRDITPDTDARIMRLAEHGRAIGADAVLFTCSAFGPCIEAAARALPLPVLKPNEAMFEEALSHGKRIGMVATFTASVATMEAEFREEADRRHPGATIRTVLPPDARRALDSGDFDSHNAQVAEAGAALRDIDAIMLAHFSTARALVMAAAACAVPVLTAPEAAVRKVRRLLSA
jgi:Asp/Glu/hydantoin racemase